MNNITIIIVVAIIEIASTNITYFGCQCQAKQTNKQFNSIWNKQFECNNRVAVKLANDTTNQATTWSQSFVISSQRHYKLEPPKDVDGTFILLIYLSFFIIFMLLFISTKRMDGIWISRYCISKRWQSTRHWRSNISFIHSFFSLEYRNDIANLGVVCLGANRIC